MAPMAWLCPRRGTERRYTISKMLPLALAAALEACLWRIVISLAITAQAARKDLRPGREGVPSDRLSHPTRGQVSASRPLRRR
jgi:hypothetical protein